MPEEIGTVIQKTGNTATVRIPRTSGCTGCHSCILSQNGTSMTVTARDTLHTKIGDRVKIEERQSGRIKAGLFLLNRHRIGNRTYQMHIVGIQKRST
jgi:hypothetical protein